MKAHPISTANSFTLNPTQPVMRTFREIATLMSAPWADEEIQELYYQEPLNGVAQLPANELPLDDNETN